MSFNPDTGEWENDTGTGGAVAEQAAAPMAPDPVPMPPPDDATMPMTAEAPQPQAAPAPDPYALPAAPSSIPLPIGAKSMATPEQATLSGQVDDTAAARRQNAMQAGDQSVARATLEAERADREQAARQAQRLEMEQAKAAQDKIIQERRAKDAADYDRYRAMGIKDPEAEQSFGHRILAALSIGLGEYSAKMTGGTNQAATIIKDATERNIAMQRAKIEKAKEDSIRAGESTDKAEHEAALKLHELQMKHAAQLDSISDDFKMRSARLGIPAARIAANADVLKLDAEAQAVKEKVLDSQRSMTDREASLAARIAARRAKAGAGGGAGANSGLSKLIAMKEKGAKDSEIALAAQDLGIPPKVWTGPVKEVVRGAAIGQRMEDKDQALQVTGPNGEKGKAHSTTDAKELNKKNQAFDQMKVRLQAAIDDIDANGTRVSPLDSQATQRRNSLMAAAAAAGRVYNGLGGTDASQRLEAEINANNGTLGHGIIRGADASVLRHNLEEAEKAHATALTVRTRQTEKAPASEKPAASPDASKRDRVKAALASPNLSTADRAKLTLWLRSN